MTLAGLRKKIRKARERRATVALEQQFLRDQWLDAEALRELQLVRLRALLEHAYRTTVYYRELFDDSGLRVADIRTLADFAEAVPPLEKSVFRERMDDLRSDDWPGRVSVTRTSGSTGIPMPFVKPKSHPTTRAIGRSVNEFMGIRGGERTIQLWGVDSSRHNYFDEKRNTHVFSFRRLPPGGIDEVADLVLSWRPEFIWGYSGALDDVAKVLESRGHTALGVRVAETFSEMLHAYQRSRIERVFGAEAFDHYGAREFNHLGIECSEHDGVHLLAHFRIFELDRVSGPDGRTGELLITNLYNRAMPFIRYRIGDTITVDEAPCPCGRSLPRARIAGRSVDQIVLRDGTRLISGFLVDLMDPGMVEKFIVHQRSYERIDCHIVPSNSFTGDFGDHVLREIRRHTQIEGVRLVLAEDLDQQIAGKYRLIRSDIADRPA